MRPRSETLPVQRHGGGYLLYVYMAVSVLTWAPASGPGPIGPGPIWPIWPIGPGPIGPIGPEPIGPIWAWAHWAHLNFAGSRRQRRKMNFAGPNSRKSKRTRPYAKQQKNTVWGVLLKSFSESLDFFFFVYPGSPLIKLDIPVLGCHPDSTARRPTGLPNFMQSIGGP